MDQIKSLPGLSTPRGFFDLSRFGPKVVTPHSALIQLRADEKRARRREVNCRRVFSGGARSTVGAALSNAPTYLPPHRPTRRPWKIAR